MSENSKSKLMTIDDTMAYAERIIAAHEEAFATVDAKLVESLSGKVSDEALILARAQMQEGLNVALLKLKRRLSSEGLRQFLESKETIGDVADWDDR